MVESFRSNASHTPRQSPIWYFVWWITHQHFFFSFRNLLPNFELMEHGSSCMELLWSNMGRSSWQLPEGYFVRYESHIWVTFSTHKTSPKMELLWSNVGPMWQLLERYSVRTFEWLFSTPKNLRCNYCGLMWVIPLHDSQKGFFVSKQNTVHRKTHFQNVSTNALLTFQ